EPRVGACHDGGREPVRVAPRGLRPARTGRQAMRAWPRVAPWRSYDPVLVANPGRLAVSGCGRVSDLGELGAELVWAGALLVVGDADPPGGAVDGDLLDAGAVGEVAFNVLFAIVAGGVGRGQLDGGLVHLCAPVAVGAAAAAGVGGGVVALPSVWKRRSRSALPTTVTELVAIATAAR